MCALAQARIMQDCTGRPCIFLLENISYAIYAANVAQKETNLLTQINPNKQKLPAAA